MQSFSFRTDIFGGRGQRDILSRPFRQFRSSTGVIVTGVARITPERLVAADRRRFYRIYMLKLRRPALFHRRPRPPPDRVCANTPPVQAFLTFQRKRVPRSISVGGRIQIVVSTVVLCLFIKSRPHSRTTPGRPSAFTTPPRIRRHATPARRCFAERRIGVRSGA